jgi:hypothetical protein
MSKKSPLVRTTIRLPDAVRAELLKDAAEARGSDQTYFVNAFIMATVDAFIAGRQKAVKAGDLNRSLNTKSAEEPTSFCCPANLLAHYRKVAKRLVGSFGALVANALAQHYVALGRVSIR